MTDNAAANPPSSTSGSTSSPEVPQRSRFTRWARYVAGAAATALAGAVAEELLHCLAEAALWLL
ncbi:hypothetical protein ACFVAV_33255 [Nocardia sp. NPDC057663]|uniref:hypothetical protein n=1 Tax=Nocardia sp. NPDC057663 TaxID=3346201 RepID=UPI00366CCFFA